MDFEQRMEAFRDRLGDVADAAFLPVSADLQYLTGVPRDVPNYGAVLHPGAWIEGLWMSPGSEPLLVLPRMTAEFGGLSASDGPRVEVLGDHDDPRQIVRRFVRDLSLGERPRIAVGDATHGSTVSEVQALLPGATFVSASEALHPLRAVKGQAEIEVMREAGRVTEAAFQDVFDKLEHGM